MFSYAKLIEHNLRNEMNGFKCCHVLSFRLSLSLSVKHLKLNNIVYSSAFGPVNFIQLLPPSPSVVYIYRMAHGEYTSKIHLSLWYLNNCLIHEHMFRILARNSETILRFWRVNVVKRTKLSSSLPFFLYISTRPKHVNACECACVRACTFCTSHS